MKPDEHPEIVAYRQRMLLDGRCDECLQICGKGMCTCGKSGKDSSELPLRKLYGQLMHEDTIAWLASRRKRK